MSKVIAVVNQKGGVGKSVTSTNLSIGMANFGKKVLIVDCDSQASQTVSLGWNQPDELPNTLATQLAKVMENKAFVATDGILHHDEGVDLIPSSIELSGLEMRLVNVMSREFARKTLLSDLRSKYDVIVLDCPPTLGMITINALAAADSIIIAERLDEDGRNQIPVIDSIGRKQERTVISESGLYAVILRSDKPNAKMFRKWITSEVLPSIRKHGAYITDDTLQKIREDSAFTDELIQKLAAERAKKSSLLDYVEKLAPKARY